MSVMKRKGEITLNEAITLVVTVIVLFFLVYLLVNLYDLFRTKTAIQQAKGDLDQVIKKIELADKDNVEQNYLLIGPKNWFVLSYSKGQTSPSACNGKDCLCICPQKSMESCEKKGVCKEYVKKIQIVSSSLITSDLNTLVISQALSISIVKKENLIEISTQIGKELSQEDRDLFNGFLDSKSQFLGEDKTIKEQVLLYVNSGKWGRDWSLKEVFKGSEQAKKDLEKNIKFYFTNYDYPIWVILQEEGKEVSSILAVETGKEREVKQRELLPSWNNYVVENPDKKNIVIKIQSR